MSRQRFCIDQDWKFIEHEQLAQEDVNWSAKEKELLGSLEHQEQGIFWPKAGHCNGPAATDHNDAHWEDIDLPHDWSITKPPSPQNPIRNAFLPLGVLWYRKTLNLKNVLSTPSTPKSQVQSLKGKRIQLHFDGVFRDMTLFVNGHLCGFHRSGYLAQRFDITEVIDDDIMNSLDQTAGHVQIAIKVNGTQKEGWYYEGVGIYRHVWLEVVDELSCTHDGIRSEVIWDSPEANASTTEPQKPSLHHATLNIEAELKNYSEASKIFHAQAYIIDPKGQIVSQQDLYHQSIQGDTIKTLSFSHEIEQPQLWDLKQAHLYTCKIRIFYSQTFHTHQSKSLNDPCDEIQRQVGFRHIAMDPKKGFFLNGKALKLKGVCCHQDQAGLGTAIPDDLHGWKIMKLKEMGANAYRCSHHPMAPEFYDACDRLGMLVLDELRIVGAHREALDQIDLWIRVRQHHPSIIMWCLGNEEMKIQHQTIGRKILSIMKRRLLKNDNTRQTTVAINTQWHEKGGFSEVVDVIGANYLELGHFDEYLTNHPHKSLLLTESCSHVSSRGEYRDDAQKQIVNSYDVHQKPKGYDELQGDHLIWPTWGKSAEDMWKTVASHPEIAGTFIWTGMDYLGEQTPYGVWPVIGSYFGAMDRCGFPKDTYHYYKSWWGDKPHLHIFPHWDHPREGDIIDVWCHSNGDTVELFLNGRSLGSKTIPQNGHCSWETPYEKGELKAIAQHSDGSTTEHSLHSSGDFHHVELKRDPPPTNHSNIAIIELEAQDAQGHPIATSHQSVRLSLDPHLQILSVCNGDPRSHAKHNNDHFELYNGKGQVILKIDDACPRLSSKLYVHSGSNVDSILIH